MSIPFVAGTTVEYCSSMLLLCAVVIISVILGIASYLLRWYIPQAFTSNE